MDDSKTRVIILGHGTSLAAELRRALDGIPEFVVETSFDDRAMIEVARAFHPDVVFRSISATRPEDMPSIEVMRRTAGLSASSFADLLDRDDAALRDASFEAGALDVLAGIPGPSELLARVRLLADRRRSFAEGRRARRLLEESAAEVARLNSRIEVAGGAGLDAVERDLARLESIAEIGDELNRFQDFDRLLDHILTEARRACGAESGAIFTVDGDRLRCRHLQNDLLDARGDRSYMDATDRPLTLDTIAGTVALTGRIVRVDDAYEIPGHHEFIYDRGRDIATGYRTGALMSIPLRTSDGEVRGVLQLANPGGEVDQAVFGDEDEHVVEHFASLAAVAIERTAMTEALVLRMIAMAEVRDPTETGAHVQRVAGYSVILYEAWAKAHDVDQGERERQRDRLRTAALLHDVGKVGVPDSILKKPGRLDELELAIMQRHTIIGARLFKGLRTDFDEVARVVALHHHERWDGKGYPGRVDLEAGPDAGMGEPMVPIHAGLAGEAIPLFARIVGLADVYDALTSRRSYKDAWPEEKALAWIRSESGGHFDPELVDLLGGAIEEFHGVRRRFAD